MLLKILRGILRYRVLRPEPQRPEPHIRFKLNGGKWTHDPREQHHLTGLKELKGKAHIIDGDTIVIKRTKIRLAGINAPELDEPWGQKSKWAMVDICKGHIITAKLTGEISHDRLVGACYLPDGTDIGAELIKRGLALDLSQISGGKYRHLEQPGARRKLRTFRNHR